MTQSDIRALAEAAFVVLSFFVMAPAVAAVIGYRASKGIPKSFNRAMYLDLLRRDRHSCGHVHPLRSPHGGQRRPVVESLAIYDSWTRHYST